MRTLSVWVAFLMFAASAAQAGVSSYPSSYHPLGSDYYEDLRTAKIAWLKSNLASVNADLITDRTRLASQSGRAASDMKETIDRLTAQVSQIQAELKVMSGGRNSGQEALLKRNVQSWIGAARRGGNGAEAIRLMHDLEGTGL